MTVTPLPLFLCMSLRSPSTYKKMQWTFRSHCRNVRCSVPADLPVDKVRSFSFGKPAVKLQEMVCVLSNRKLLKSRSLRDAWALTAKWLASYQLVEAVYFIAVGAATRWIAGPAPRGPHQVAKNGGGICRSSEVGCCTSHAKHGTCMTDVRGQAMSAQGSQKEI